MVSTPSDLNAVGNNETVEIDLNQLAQNEAISRPERITRLAAQVESLFPGEGLAELRQNIVQRSFNVPQWGDYHNEGIFMDTHLAAILGNIDNIEAGNFPDTVPSEVRAWMRDVVDGNRQTLDMYTYLHDISKPDCMTIKYEDGTEEIVTWEQWVGKLPEGVQGNPVEFKKFCKDKGISGISYYHKERKETLISLDGDVINDLSEVGRVLEELDRLNPNGAIVVYKSDDKKTFPIEDWNQFVGENAGDAALFAQFCQEQEIASISFYEKKEGKKHGNEGAHDLQDLAESAGLSNLLLKAIDKHEVAYQFEKVNLKAYEKHFGGLTEEEIKWVITASYVDTMASHRKNGQPDLTNFINMVNTIHNYSVIQFIESQTMPNGNVSEGLDPKKVAQELLELRKQETRFQVTQEDLLQQLLDKCKPTRYNLEKLRFSLKALVTTDQISQELSEEIITCFDESGNPDNDKLKGVKKKLGKLNRLFAEAMKDAEL